uniref:Uncharacterized protein n=1 Tax=Strongyloides venezuelensis TaxID=75913 RepID=A0A0K0FZR2_STRVS
MIPHHAEFSNYCEYDNFLKGNVFEDMTEIFLGNITSGTTINVKDTVYCMDCTSDNCSIEIFLSNKTFLLPPLRFKISRTRELGIPYNSTSFKKEFLRQKK